MSEIEDLLRQHGAVLERTKKHKVWRLPDNRVWIVSGTPGCHRAEQNNLHDLRRFLGLTKTQACAGERRERKPKRQRSVFEMKTEPARPVLDMRAQLARLKGEY